MFLKKLYVRLWLAVVLAVGVLTLLVGWAWRLTAEPPLREVVIRNEAGQIIGQGRPRWMRPAPDSPDESGSAPPPGGESARVWPGPRGQFGNGPEFVLRMQDGRNLHMHMPRPAPQPWSRPPFGFWWTLALVGVAVALGTYPVVRKLTRRLERLEQGVRQWGEGDLATRIPDAGDDEVAFLARRFNEAAERIGTLVRSHEQLLASQKSLLANASHELRSPLARIRMSLELMGGDSSPSWRQEISRNIAELDQLIDEILLASRLDAREADLGTVEPVDLVGLVAEECARAGAEFDWQPPPSTDGSAAAPAVLPVQGVAKLLRRLVRNLLDNARRHGAGDVSVSLRAVQGQAELRVADRGPGVPPALRERIFEPFFRLPGATERDGGVGLGLALVRSIALRHGGSVSCVERPGGGACFVLCLPLPAPA